MLNQATVRYQEVGLGNWLSVLSVQGANNRADLNQTLQLGVIQKSPTMRVQRPALLEVVQPRPACASEGLLGL